MTPEPFTDLERMGRHEEPTRHADHVLICAIIAFALGLILAGSLWKALAAAALAAVAMKQLSRVGQRWPL